MLPQYERLNDRSASAVEVDEDDDVNESKTTLLPSSPRKLIKIRISFGKFSLIVGSLPFFSFIFCVIWSILYFFERSTATHCGVPNFLPSISAAIGNYQPQRFIWQLAILLQAIPRLMVTYQYMKHYGQIIRVNRRPIAYTACIFNVVENFALVGLSLWTSSSDYEIHKTCFIVFIATSECYMLITYFINKNARKLMDSISKLDVKSLKFKRNLFLLNIISFTMAGYFFMRHNSHCEPGMYTLFALMEYLVVLTNIGFHMTAYWDFNDKTVVFDTVNYCYMTSSYSYI